jgi:hypothetical protein
MEFDEEAVFPTRKKLTLAKEPQTSGDDSQ